jgi:ribosomal protein S18 acetylase RimI-like enzyme
MGGDTATDLRPATPADVDDVIAVARECWETDYPDILSRETVAAGVDEWYDRETIETDVRTADAILLVAVRDETVVGFAHGICDDDTGTILRLYVAPDARGHGIGRDLCRTAEEELAVRGARRVRAMVLAENDQGNEFYQALGYERADAGRTVIAGEGYDENVYEKVVAES